MRLYRLIKFVFMITVVALIYIHMQMRIFDLAYQAKFKEKHIRKFIEDNGQVTYSILSMKSSHHIGDKVLKEDSKWQFADGSHIMRVPMPSALAKKEKTLHEERAEKTQALLSLISFKSQAEAKPQD